ncbi:MAG TPA: hypothetical protein PLZ36_04410, partial [Armatimonadota bacterium]|nr:hypothetical protein [Armatimonadota bacterium]
MSLLPGTIHMTALVNPPPAQQTAAGAPVNTGHGPFAGLVAELQLLVTTPGQAQTPPGIAANANEVPDVAASPPDSLPAAVTPDDPARPPGAAESTPRATKYDHPLTGMGDADDAPVDHAPASPALSVAAPYGMHAPRNITATAHARPSAQILPREQQSRDEALPLADAGERIPSLTRPPEREDAATDRPSSPVEMPVAGEAPLVLPIPYAVALDSARPAPVAKIGMPPPDLLSPTGTLPGETVAPREQAHGAPVMRAVPPAQHATPQTGFGHTPASPPVSTASSAVAAPDRPPLGVMPDQHLPAPPPQPVSGALTPPTPLPTPSDHPLLPENVALMHDAPVPLPQHPARTAAPTGAVWHATVVPGEFLAAHPVEHLPDARAATATALALPAEVTALAVGQLQEKTPPRAVEDVFPAEDMPAVIREPGENSSHGLRRTIMAVQTLVQEPEGGTRQEQRDAALAGSDVSVPHERFAERDRAHQAAQRAGRSP